MAKKLESFQFGRGKDRGGPSYQWDYWLDGSIWELKSGEDFTCKPVSIQSIAHHVATARGLKIKTRIVGDVFVMQAILPNGQT